ncbi:recombinase family protein [Ethanoligenens sp.]|uniref:recombinase family protein n=1 Tax=Ethanoligenens sp. TaxID=2099655 RepID=UPI0039E9C70E
MTNQDAIKVGIYVRLSKDDERAGESVSIKNQKLMLTHYAEQQGWFDYSIYCDDGYSGTSFQRPGVERLIEDAKDGKINLILVKDLSRFGRNYIQVGQFTDYVFPMIGCRFIAVNDGVDTLHNDNDMMPFRNLFNEFQSKDTSKKIKAVKRACATAGRYIGAYAPYGYLKSSEDKHHLVIDEEVAPVVRRIFSLRCEGLGYRAIASVLNRDHILPPREHYYRLLQKINPFYSNHLWNEVTIKTLIRNEVYLGNTVQMKTGTASYKNHKQIKKTEDNWIRVDGTHEPIIDRATWDLCVEIDRKRFKPRTHKNGEISLFGGLVRCADCGFAMRYCEENHVRKNGSKVKYVSYVCGNYASSGKSACSAHIIYLKPLSELVLDDIRRQASGVLQDEDKVRQELLRQKSKQSEQQLAADHKALKTTGKRLKELDRLISSLYEDKVRGAIPESVCVGLMQKYEAERKEKTAQAHGLEEKIAASAQNEREVDSFLAAIKKYVAVEQLDREMLLELINYIEVGERFIKGNQKYRKITIHYNFVGKIE